tara:strand:- start:98 stop:340 length:243 start_codon:yes stop_codon:yes gene_type:complete
MSNPWDSFNPHTLGHLISLQAKLMKHVKYENGKACHTYLTIVDKHWPGKNDGAFTNCPIDRKLLRDAVNLANKWIKDSFN